jgi:excinuclease ABC subunit C
MARSALGTCVQVFFIRSGKMIGREHFLIKGSEGEEDAEILAAFIKQYYSKAAFIPREVLLPVELAEQQLLADWLTGLKGGKIEVENPKRGTKKDIVNMAADNASIVLTQQAENINRLAEHTEGAAAELGEYLGLPNAPERMECFDISHTQGSETVASMVVFENGEPKKSDYRRFKLRTVEGKPDDFKSMQEVVLRRYREAAEPLPDLIIIDGGKGQLSAALEVIRGVGLSDIMVVGLAKQIEYIFRENISEPLILPRQSQPLYLMQRIRDEAHRFAITYHRKLRAKRNMVSILDHIPGIGASAGMHYGMNSAA